jgi:hypothetical protein
MAFRFIGNKNTSVWLDRNDIVLGVEPLPCATSTGVRFIWRTDGLLHTIIPRVNGRTHGKMVVLRGAIAKRE